MYLTLTVHLQSPLYLPPRSLLSSADLLKFDVTLPTLDHEDIYKLPGRGSLSHHQVPAYISPLHSPPVPFILKKTKTPVTSASLSNHLTRHPPVSK
jgi:hypothetical protein